MRSLRLDAPITVGGLDFWNRSSALTIEPLDDPQDFGWYWRVGQEDVPITPEIMGTCTWNRSVALKHRRAHFKEFEHVAFLHMLRLRGVRISLQGSDRPPFMCQKDLWHKIRPILSEGESLLPYVPEGMPDHPVFRSSASNPEERLVDYELCRDDLTLCGVVRYGDQLPCAHRFKLGFRESALDDTSIENIDRLVSARTLGKPQVLRHAVPVFSNAPLAQGARWPHAHKLLWMPKPDAPEREWADFSTELAQHKVFDGALVSFIAPPQYVLRGRVYFFRSNHMMDLDFMRWYWGKENVLTPMNELCFA